MTPTENETQGVTTLMGQAGWGTYIGLVGTKKSPVTIAAAQGAVKYLWTGSRLLGGEGLPSFCTVPVKIIVTETGVSTHAQPCSKQLDMSV